ncbi:MAG: potassium/proton antiporter [Paludibacteraceae bacterium]|nr:potassium/proton antiporter [Paludibacteraceae bacterium]
MEVELILLVLSLLFFASIFSDRIGNKYGVPALLLFLAVGMVFGPDGFGKWLREDGVGFISNISIDGAQAIGTVALCVILFSGGMDTKLSDIRPVMKQGVILATIGVLLTALIAGTLIYFIFGWINALASVGFAVALLMASTMSSTDSASVFSILRTNGVGLKHNLRPLLELESGANDPMAYVLTVTLIGVVTATTKQVTGLSILQEIVIQLIMGAVIGFGFGKGAIALMRKVRLSNESLYPIMILTFCIFIFAVTHYFKGNSYLAVYMGGLMIGNSKFTRKRQTKSFFDGLTWLSQLLMFLMLGLMVKPHELFNWQVWLPCLIISIVMIFIARPLSVFICLAPFKEFRGNDKALVSWVGLKGAVPIIFAILCMSHHVPHANLIFNVVFACTLVSLLVQGTTLSKMAESLHLSMPSKEEKRLLHFDMDLPEEIESSATEKAVTAEMLANGNRLMDMQIPRQTLVIMVRRNEEFFVPTGSSELQEGDQLLVIADKDAEAAKKLQDEEDAVELKDWSLQLLNNTTTFVRDNWRKLVNGEKRIKK